MDVATMALFMKNINLKLIDIAADHWLTEVASISLSLFLCLIT